MAVTCSKAIKRHFRLVFQNSCKVYGHERACSTIIKKSINLYNLYTASSRNFSNSAINKYFAISKPEKAMGALSPLDPSSFSRPEIAVIKHISLILDVDFENKVLTGSADLNFDILQATDEIILDVNNLIIQSIELNDGTELKYKINEHIPNFGSKLSIILPPLTSTGKNTLKLVELNESETEAKQNCLKIEKSTGTLILDFADDMYKPNMSNYKDHKVCNSNASKPKEKKFKSDIVKCKVSKPEVKENVDDTCIPYLSENTKGACKPVSDNKDKCKPYLSKQEDNCTSNINKPLDICEPCIGKNKEDIIKPYMTKCVKNICNTKQAENFKSDEDFGNFLVGYSQNLCHPKKINRKMGLSWWNTKLAKLKKEVDRRKRRIRNARPDRRELVIRHYLEFKQLYKQEIKNALATSWENAKIVNPERRAKKRLVIRIKYKTSPSASALQWLEPNQTSGKKHPYMFSQCQPIHARSILPCQDTPAVKFTYDAEVTAPEEFTVLMSAVRGESRCKNTKFQQSVPIPSYLLAIAVGVLEHRRLGPRSLVWSEKEEIERSAWEFADTEKYLKAAENLCGPYQWGQYDLLVLPPSFPYGGMENPCLTFVTPTLLAGDRSQADVIVHEIMHSWTGNLVTNKNFEHFWLNEGFTVFLERKVGASLIADPVEAKRSRDFHSLLGLQELGEAVNDELGPTNKLTRLVVNLKGIHPDDAFSTIPYEKGSLFLYYLENLFGGPEVFDGFLRSYLGKFQKRSLDTEEFKQYFLSYFCDNKNLTTVDWDAWFFSSGMPPIIPDYDTSMTKAVTALLTKIKEQCSFSYDDVKNFTPHQMINLLQELIDRDPLPVDKLRALGDIYKINDSKNTEIIYRWVRLGIRSRDNTKLNEAFNFVNRQGRMKYVRPVYRDLYAWEEVRQQAIDNFLQNEPYMMHVSAYTVRKDLHLSK